MSDHARPDVEAVRELETLVRQMAEQLASFRRRALSAEERLRHLDTHDDQPDPPRVRERIRALEQENASLRGRLEAATTRTRSVLERVHFLRQQAQLEDR
ncbi:MAG TPA: hypothetical protein VJW73_17815 [Gemmatimonadaceae bacterium]|nr:hypothetical protein [Gemmatimonadaceae bacterium]